MSKKRPGVKGKSRKRLEKAQARYEQLKRKRKQKLTDTMANPLGGYSTERPGL